MKSGITKVTNHISHNEGLIFERSQKGRIGYRLPPLDVEEQAINEIIPQAFQREDDLVGVPEVSEVDVIRHFTRMSTWNYSIDLGMYPLGSCTMKYNSRLNERVARIAGFADLCLYFGEFGAASRVKLVNNLLVAIHIAATAEAMALGLKAGVDVPLMIKAIATGSGGSTQFGIRAPWMADRRFLPAQGTVPTLQHYFPMIGDFADSVGVATPLLDCAAALYERFVTMGFGEFDGAKMVDVIASLPGLKTRLKTRTKMKTKTNKKAKTKARRSKRKGVPA